MGQIALSRFKPYFIFRKSLFSCCVYQPTDRLQGGVNIDERLSTGGQLGKTSEDVISFLHFCEVSEISR